MDAPKKRARSREVSRPHVIALCFSAFLAVFAYRLYDLQITRYHQFATQSESNYQRDEIVRALRGEIRTRDGLLLATNRMAVDLIYKGGDVAAWPQIRYLSGFADVQLPSVAPGGEVTLVRNVPADKISALQEYTVMQPNLELRERVERVYPQGTFAAHMVGYVAEANEREVEEDGYALADLVGRSGLEASLQHELRGENGIRRLEVTAAGRPQTERIIDPGQKGRDVVLTIDAKLQRAAEKALQEGLADVNKARLKRASPTESVVKGAIIALDPRTNEVLALASAPTFNPNWFAQSPRPPQLAEALQGNGGQPMLNRVVQMFDAGSVFKPTSTLAYIEKWGNKTFACPPGIRFGGWRRNWAGHHMGQMDGRKAISNSCNTWYYQAAIDADPIVFSNYLARRAKDMGFGGPTGLELIGEKIGNLPSAESYKARKADYWPGQALSFAIGQDALLVTPAQIAYALSTLVNEGTQRPLTLVRSVNGQRAAAKPAKRVPGARKNFRLIKEGMEMTTLQLGGVNGNGTASHILGPHRFPVRTGGKTGTAENALSRRYNYAYTNAWYEGYGPVDNPDLLVVAFFENGGEGSGTALPAVAKVFAAHWCLKVDGRGYLEGPPSSQQPCLKNQAMEVEQLVVRKPGKQP
ncbi:cell division protein FtsI/penicillin-binding protein 2 [Deinococcus peraridilitoris DSM 19664]|uniref:beta-lactamase n=1 Tax=Deinococcus peraridilitoris (strain DSM 19664 / LMG 22246 / CIP 109416 / KR-200) TaxID=937777 RepID=K9ZWB3_DEIPD|nr:cell division protein FtsI/penicillin-binding protein 2 [Deinococcus peraridilitoris DSM 19664]